MVLIICSSFFFPPFSPFDMEQQKFSSVFGAHVIKHNLAFPMVGGCFIFESELFPLLTINLFFSQLAA